MLGGRLTYHSGCRRGSSQRTAAPTGPHRTGHGDSTAQDRTVRPPSLPQRPPAVGAASGPPTARPTPKTRPDRTGHRAGTGQDRTEQSRPLCAVQRPAPTGPTLISPTFIGLFVNDHEEQIAGRNIVRGLSIRLLGGYRRGAAARLRAPAVNLPEHPKKAFLFRNANGTTLNAGDDRQ